MEANKSSGLISIILGLILIIFLLLVQNSIHPYWSKLIILRYSINTN